MTRRSVVVVSLALTLAGCSKTTFDSNIASGDSTVLATTTTLPKGTAAQLLPVMLDAVKGLSVKVAANKGDNETALLIEQIWTAIRPEIQATHKGLVPDFEFIVRRCRAATDRHRPADADRAYRNMVSLVDAIMGPTAS